MRLGLTAILCVVAVAGPLLLLEDPVLRRAAIAAAICLVLWLAEATQSHVPTFVLLFAVPMLLGGYGPDYQLPRVLQWGADPVLLLFLGGFTLGAAATRYGVDALVARAVVRLSRRSRRLLVALVAAGTAALSMWMSNIAAAAMMLAALRPALGDRRDHGFRRAALLAVALGANFGGMATPIGTGPNAIAMSAAFPARIDFLRWMLLAVPLTAAMLLVGTIALMVRHRVRGIFSVELRHPERDPRTNWVMAIFFLCVALWLTEPLHHIRSELVAVAAVAALFGTGLLDRRDLARIDWSTLLLIAGGIMLGRLLEQSGLLRAAASAVDWTAMPEHVRMFLFVFAAALLSALMSNTATATMLIPLGMTLQPAPSTAVLVAIGCSFGVPFVISTPPNAMVIGEGGVRSSDLLWPGLPLMIGGALLVSATGPLVLRLVGIP